MSALTQALALARRRRPSQAIVRRHKDEQQPGTGTNENGPPVETNPTPNAWPTDGDS